MSAPVIVRELRVRRPSGDKAAIYVLTERATKFHAGWWSKEKGGCIAGECAACKHGEPPKTS